MACLLSLSDLGVAQQPLELGIKSFLRQSDLLRSCGKRADVALGKKRRENPELALPLLVLRRQAIKVTEARKDVTAEKVGALCQALVDDGLALLKVGTKISPFLDSRIEKASTDNRAVLEALDRSIYIQEAKRAIKPFLGRGTYRGMFQAHAEEASKMTKAFLFIFSDRSSGSAMTRAYAAEGVAELCPQSELAKTREAVSAIFTAKDESSAMKDTAMILLARLGDRSHVNRALLIHRNIVAKQLKLPHEKRSYPTLLFSYEYMSDILQRVGDLKTVAEINADYLGLVFSLVNYKNQSPEARSNIAAKCYDFACVLSQLGRVEFGLYILETSFSWGFSAFDWANEDKELKRLRQDPRYGALVKKWRSRKAELGSFVFDGPTFLAKAGRTASGNTSRPTSRKSK